MMATMILPIQGFLEAFIKLGKFQKKLRVLIDSLRLFIDFARKEPFSFCEIPSLMPVFFLATMDKGQGATSVLCFSTSPSAYKASCEKKTGVKDAGFLARAFRNIMKKSMVFCDIRLYLKRIQKFQFSDEQYTTTKLRMK